MHRHAAALINGARSSRYLGADRAADRRPAALLQRFVDLGWVVRAERRVVRITDEGRAGLTGRLGVHVSD
jgi:hypothetical protein